MAMMPHISTIIRQYEVVILLRPDTSDSGQTTIRELVDKLVAQSDGQTVRWETWGKRRLAYPIAKLNRAVYLYCNFVTGQHGISELERNLRISEQVIRYQTVLLQDEVDLSTFDMEAEGAKKTPLHMSPEDISAAEKRQAEQEAQRMAAETAAAAAAEAAPAKEAPEAEAAPAKEAPEAEAAPAKEAAEAAAEAAPTEKAPEAEAAPTEKAPEAEAAPAEEAPEAEAAPAKETLEAEAAPAEESETSADDETQEDDGTEKSK